MAGEIKIWCVSLWDPHQLWQTFRVKEDAYKQACEWMDEKIKNDTENYSDEDYENITRIMNGSADWENKFNSIIDQAYEGDQFTVEETTLN